MLQKHEYIEENQISSINNNNSKIKEIYSETPQSTPGNESIISNSNNYKTNSLKESTASSILGQPYNKKIQKKRRSSNSNDKFDKKLTINDFERNNYIYDLEFQTKGFMNKINPPKSHKFPRSKQFEIYRDYLVKELGQKKKTDKKKSRELKTSNH